MLNHFFFNDGVFDYGFSDSHPLKPERLYRMFALLDHYVGGYKIDAPSASKSDLLRVHTENYIEAVKRISGDVETNPSDELDDLRTQYGFWGDNPAFPGMFEAAAAYSGATAAAALAVIDGADLAYSIGGGLHHALCDKASGFCIFNDCAIAASILRDRFERVIYIDIDVHHGDGVQWLFYNDPSVLTYSIHESGRTLWPGTGSLDETGAGCTSFNLPVAAGTTASVWLNGFQRTIVPIIETWRPEAIVLQMGTDSHYLDPLAHLLSDQSAWLDAVLTVKNFGLPLVALGGGGYNLTTVPRMWTSALLSLAEIDYTDRIPRDLQAKVGATTFSDVDYPYRDQERGEDQMERVVSHLLEVNLPQLGG